MAKSEVQSTLTQAFDHVISQGDGTYWLRKSGVSFFYLPQRLMNQVQRMKTGPVDQFFAGRSQRSGGNSAGRMYLVSEGVTLLDALKPIPAWVRKFRKWSSSDALGDLSPPLADIAREALVDLFCLLHDRERPRARPKPPTLNLSVPSIDFDVGETTLRFEVGESYGVAAFLEERRSTVKARTRRWKGRAMVAKGTSSAVVAEGLIAAGRIGPSDVRRKWGLDL